MYTICKWIPTPVKLHHLDPLAGEAQAHPPQKNLTCDAAFHDLKELTMRIMSYADYKMTRHSPVSYDSLLVAKGSRLAKGQDSRPVGNHIYVSLQKRNHPEYWSINGGAVWKIGGIIANCEGDSGNLFLNVVIQHQCIPNRFSTMVSTSNSSQKRVPPLFFWLMHVDDIFNRWYARGFRALQLVYN